ncbi:unnamed protein product [Porites evermanni]|uniref:Uncharacterized protein n=1 Tax=Porites evermanni TaxID=104178 RepID=A0ABN8QEP3_9CNID|nr:unnamed protein product [Porites evermanni]
MMESGKQPYLTLISLLPTYLCLLVVNIRFAVLLVLEIRKTGFRFFRRIRERYRECSDTILIESPGVEHIKKLLYPGENSGATHTNEKWYLRLIPFIYKPRADFKFSTQFISTLMVAAIVIFQLLVSFLGRFAVYKKTLTKNYCGNDNCKDLFGVIFGSLQTAYIFSWFISAILLLHFMKCHRSHVLQLYQGKKAFYQQVEVSPTTLVENSILFSGYQVAYTIAGRKFLEFFFSTLLGIFDIGYMVLGLSLAVVCVILGLIVKYWNDIIDQEQLKKFVLTALPTVIIAILLWCFQLFLGHFVFRDRTLPKTTITVNNRRLYSIISYFFFFYNVLVGLFSCLMRIFKGTVLGVLFLGRIDRTVLMQGFQTWDPAFVAYLGFINVLVAHSHPVVLMFCQLLINRHNNRCFESENSLTNICSLECESSYECGSADEKIGILSDKGPLKTYDAHYTRNRRLSVTAVNRWHVAVTLLRNPSLIKYRKQRSKDSVKPLLSLGSIHGDVNASV